jgi:catechol 2,3-dioxygenase-like lactoylglutathione lyase family enzyme
VVPPRPYTRRPSRSLHLGVIGSLEMTALFRKVDCHSIPVADLDAALAFYRDGLGHELIWRDDSAAGLRLPDSNAELVLHTEKRPIDTDLLVASVPAAISRLLKRAGRWLQGHSRFESVCAP